MTGTVQDELMPMFTADPERDEDRWYELDPASIDKPGEGASPGHDDCTPEKRGAGGMRAQAGRSPAPPSPCSCRSSARCMDCMERDGLTRGPLA